MNTLWKWVSGLLGLALALMVAAFKLVSHQKARAEGRADSEQTRADSAEARIDQRDRAEQASTEAKQEGERRIEEAVERAGTGRRDHFE